MLEQHWGFSAAVAIFRNETHFLDIPYNKPNLILRRLVHKHETKKIDWTTNGSEENV